MDPVSKLHASRRRRRQALWLVLWAVLCAPAAGQRVRIELDNEDHIRGILEQVGDDVLVVRSSWAGRIDVRRDAIASIRSFGPVRVELFDGSILEGSVDGNATSLHVDDAAHPRSVAWKEVASISPAEARDDDAVRTVWDRSVTASYTRIEADGDSVEDLDVDLRVSALRGLYDYSAELEADVADSAEAFDRKIDLDLESGRRLGEWFRLEGSAEMLRDDKLGIDEYASVGVGGGVATSSETVSFRSTLGVAWENRRTTVGDSEDLLLGTWRTTVTWRLLPSLRLSERLVVKASDDDADTFVESDFELVNRLSHGWGLVLGHEYTYDANPPPPKVGTEWDFGLRYTF